MKACVLHDIGDLRVEDIPMPTLKEGEVLLRVKAAGICGSDIPRVLTKGTYHFPTVPGHEFSGEIVQVSEGVSKDLIKKRATVFPLRPCMKCESCQIGAYAQCKDYNYFGSRCDGGFEEFLAVPVWNLVMLPDEITYEEAAMTEPAAVAIHALRQATIEIGDNVAIFGSGPIGLMLANWAKIWGANKVFLIDIDEEKINFAKELGFNHVINSLNVDPVEYIMKNTNNVGSDVCIEGAGASITLEQCLNCARTFGRVVAMGNPSGEMKLSQKGYWQLLRKQLKLQGTWNSSYVSLPKNDWKLVINTMQSGKLNVKPFITHKVSLEEGIKPFLMMKNKEEFYNKVMFIL